MKKIYLIILGILMITIIGASVYFLINRSESPTKPEVELNQGFAQVWGKNEIVVGLDEAYPPITFKDEKGEIVGFDVDLAKEAFKRIGLTPIFKPMNWDTIVMSLTKGDIDVVWSGMSINEERKEKIDFSKPYFKGGYVYILKSDSNVLDTSQLKGKIIGVQAGSSNEDDFRKSDLFNEVESLKTYPSFEDAMLDLKVGRIDAVYGDLTFANYFINLNKLGYKTIDEVFAEDEGAGVGIRKSDQALRTELNKILDEMKKDGTAQQLSEKWFGKNFVI